MSAVFFNHDNITILLWKTIPPTSFDFSFFVYFNIKDGSILSWLAHFNFLDNNGFLG